MYLSTEIATVLAEVFQAEKRVINRSRRSPWLVSFELETDVVLLDLSGKFPLRAGASMKLISGPVSYTQNWARGFYEVYTDIQGLYYPSSMTNEPIIALNERARDAFPSLPIFHRVLDDLLLLEPLRNAAKEIHCGLI